MLVSATVALRHHVNVVALFCASGKAVLKKREDNFFKMISFKTKHSLPLEKFPSIKLHPVS